MEEENRQNVPKFVRLIVLCRYLQMPAIPIITTILGKFMYGTYILHTYISVCSVYMYG